MGLVRLTGCGPLNLGAIFGAFRNPGTAVVKLNAAIPAMHQAASAHALPQVQKAAQHFIDFVPLFQLGDPVRAAFRAAAVGAKTILK